MGLQQIVLVAGLVVVLLLDLANQRLLGETPESEREVLEELLRPLWLSVVLFIGVLVAELVRVALDSNLLAFRLAPVAVGLLASALAFVIRRRAFMIYELSADESDTDRIARARRLHRRAELSLIAGCALWPAIAAYRF